MGIDSILFILALLILVVFYISQPINRHSVRLSAEEKSASALLAERDRILDALLELDFDHDLGKIPVEIYPEQRADLVQRGAEILQQLDTLPSRDDDSKLEAVISSRRAKKSVGSEPQDLEKLIAERKERGIGTSGKFCFNCGDTINATDKFCSHCGTDLS